MLILSMWISLGAMGTNYYVSTSGSDSNSGTSTSSPFATLAHAVGVVSAGDYIYLRGGTHVVASSPIVITTNGTSSANIHVYAYSGETPILQFDNNENSSNRGIVMDGDYWHWKGITIEKAGDNGMLLSGNNNTIEDCIFRKNHDTGLQLSRYNTSANSISEWPSNNLVVGCESYDNQDSGNENADGFAAKLTCGTGNVFRDCVSHHNIDDGWDLYTKSSTGPIGEVTFENCIAHNNGTLTDGSTSGGGDKNGFKLGSSSNIVNHTLIRCIAFNNGKHGFTDNGNIGNIKFYNLTSYNNGDYNYHTRDNASHTFRNCITLNGNHTDRIVGDAPTSCNGFDDTDTNWSVVVTSSDFQTLTPGSNSDPTSNGFLNLSSSSSLIDAGCSNAGVTYNGSAPDLGAIEYGGSTPTAYTLSTNVSGSGSVSPSSGAYTSGTSVSLTATPASGWVFSHWSGDASGSSNPISVTMNSNKSVTAVFESPATTYTLTTSVVGQGTVSPSGGTYSSGSTVTLTATPSSGYTFSGWSGDASGTNASTTITMNSDKSVVATFTPNSGGTVTRIEDTDAGTISYDGSLKSYSAADNGTAINLSNSLSQQIVWNYSASSAGTYTLTFRYTRKASMNSSVNIIVNNGSAQTLSLPETSSSTFSTASLNANLNSGTNEIILETNADGESADIDWIEIEGGSSGTTATLTKHGSGSSTQSVEVNTAITSFYYSWTDATTVSVNGLPTGIAASIDNSAQTVTISGTPTVTGTYNFTVTTVGASTNVSTSGVITVTNAPCTPTVITPYVQIDGGSWSQTASATVNEGSTVKFGPQPVSGGSWSWSGPNSYSATSREITISNIQAGDAGSYIATYTNDSGCTSNQTFTITVNLSSSTVTIQEDIDGFCSVDGTVDTNHTGYTGTGFSNTVNASGNGITWSVSVPLSGNYDLIWRYANGGSTDRTAQIMVDGSIVMSSISMPTTGSWDTWAETSATTISLPAGTVLIRLEATNSSGLSNIDYISIYGATVTPVSCAGQKSVVLSSGQLENMENIFYPNPVEQMLYFNIPDLEETIQVDILNMNGAVLISKELNANDQNIDVTNLSKGSYIIKACYNGEIVSKMLLKN